MERSALVALGALGAIALYLMSDQGPSLSQKAEFAAELGGIVKALTQAKGWNSDEVVALIVAWAAMESNWGTSKLAVQGNNLFGIKAGDTWKGQGKPYDSYVTHEHQGTPQEVTITATFRHYADWTESVKDFLHLLEIQNAYKPIFAALGRGDVGGALQAADASGYSTAANYSKRIEGALNTLQGLA